MQKLVEAKFSIGNIVKHKFLNFRGVIFDLDPEFNNTEEWYQAIPKQIRPKKEQPFYHLFAENESVNVHNLKMLAQLPSENFTSKSIDVIPKSFSDTEKNRVKIMKQTDTGGLAAELILKVGARVMLVSNIDIDERPDLAQKYRVRGVPTLIKVDKEGVEVSRVVGAQTQAKLEEWLSE